jgi:hypothetical protein
MTQIFQIGLLSLVQESNAFGIFMAYKLSEYILKGLDDPHFELRNGFERKVRKIRFIKYAQIIILTATLYFSFQIITFYAQMLVFGLKIFIAQNMCEMKHWVKDLVWSSL